MMAKPNPAMAALAAKLAAKKKAQPDESDDDSSDAQGGELAMKAMKAAMDKGDFGKAFSHLKEAYDLCGE